jgi:hypothetical protein
VKLELATLTLFQDSSLYLSVDFIEQRAPATFDQQAAYSAFARHDFVLSANTHFRSWQSNCGKNFLVTSMPNCFSPSDENIFISAVIPGFYVAFYFAAARFLFAVH